MERIAGARVVVVGMGRSGLAAIELLREHGAVVEATDSRDLREIPDAAAKLEAWSVPFRPQSAEVFRGKDLAVISPGVPPDLGELDKARAAGITVIGELELASYYMQGKTIGITGSNGKTTTTALTGHILRETGVAAQVGGNIGTPPAAMVRSSKPGQWNVLELSSFQLETIRHFRAAVGAGLNLTPDHLDRHHSLEAYSAAKRRLFETQQPEDFAVLNADDPACVGWAAATRGRTLWFSMTRAVTPGLWLDRGTIFFDDEPLLESREIPLRGRHNIENVMAAAAAARLAGATLPGIAAAVKGFPGVEHRLEFVRGVSGVAFYNDSKATNVDATQKAIDAFDSPLWVILGGKDKDSDYTVLAKPLAGRAKAALLVGAAAPKIAAHLGGALRLIECGTIDAAVARAYQEAAPGDTVLLAPACASFDQFDNFEHRGRVFKSLVANLQEKQ